MAVKIDIIEGHQVTMDKGRVTRLVRRAHVTGVDSSVASKVGYNLAKESGIPQYPAAHPSVSGLFVEGHQVNRATGHNSGFVDIIYTRPEGGTVVTDPDGEVPFVFTNGGGGYQQVPSYRDADGNDVTVTLGGVSRPSRGSVFVGMVSIAGYEVRETTTPGTRLRTYNGKQNSTTWQGFAAKSWLCRGNMRHVEDNLWRFDWEFLLNESQFGWNDEVFFLDGDGPPVTSTSAEFKTAQTVNFSGIGGAA